MATKEEAVLEQVKQTVCAAAKKLAALSPEYQRVSWLLEDALLFLDDKDDENISVSKLLQQELGDEYIALTASNS